MKGAYILIVIICQLLILTKYFRNIYKYLHKVNESNVDHQVRDSNKSKEFLSVQVIIILNYNIIQYIYNIYIIQYSNTKWVLS